MPRPSPNSKWPRRSKRPATPPRTARCGRISGLPIYGALMKLPIRRFTHWPVTLLIGQARCSRTQPICWPHGPAWLWPVINSRWREPWPTVHWHCNPTASPPASPSSMPPLNSVLTTPPRRWWTASLTNAQGWRRSPDCRICVNCRATCWEPKRRCALRWRPPPLDHWTAR